MHPPGHEVHPQPEQESIFRTVFAGFGGIFTQSLRATTKKSSSTFLAKKCTPPKQNPGSAYVLTYKYRKNNKLNPLLQITSTPRRVLTLRQHTTSTSCRACWFTAQCAHRRSQDFLWGALFHRKS